MIDQSKLTKAEQAYLRDLRDVANQARVWNAMQNDYMVKLGLRNAVLKMEKYRG